MLTPDNLVGGVGIVLDEAPLPEAPRRNLSTFGRINWRQSCRLQTDKGTKLAKLVGMVGKTAHLSPHVHEVRTADLGLAGVQSGVWRVLVS
jgi:hypothetical protein